MRLTTTISRLSVLSGKMELRYNAGRLALCARHRMCDRIHAVSEKSRIPKRRSPPGLSSRQAFYTPVRFAPRSRYSFAKVFASRVIGSNKQPCFTTQNRNATTVTFASFGVSVVRYIQAGSALFSPQHQLLTAASADRLTNAHRHQSACVL